MNPQYGVREQNLTLKDMESTDTMRVVGNDGKSYRVPAESVLNAIGGGSGDVESVNGKTGDVVLDAGDIAFDDEETYSEGSVGDGLSSLKTDINQLSNNKADIIFSNAAGSIASFTDGADGLPMKSVVAHIEPVQSGTGDPSPTNIRPISGWTRANIARTGKNILDVDKYGKALPFSQNGITWSKVRDGVYHVEGTATASAYYNITYRSGLDNAMPCSALRGENLYLSITNDNIICAVGYFKADGTFESIANGSVLPDEAVALRSYLRIATGTTINTDFSIQLEVGSTATDYEPYQGETFTIDLDGTIYGGYVDFVSGKLVVDRVLETLDGSQPVSDNGFQPYGGIQIKYTPSQEKKYASDQQHQNEGIISDKFDSSEAMPSTAYKVTGRSTSGNIFFNMPPDITTAQEARTWFGNNHTQISYLLVTPIEYDLTPQEITSLLGTNNVWSDTGDTDVTYRADTKLYIDGKQIDIRSTIAPIEDGATASQAYTTGKFFYRNGSFCKAKTSIASGATFTLGTNYEVTTVSAELFTALS